MVIFGTFCVVGTFGTAVAVVYSTLRIGSVFTTLGIIPSEFWYIWCTLVHLTFGTPVGTLSIFVGTLTSFLAHRDDSWSFRHVWYIWYVWYTRDRISV